MALIVKIYVNDDLIHDTHVVRIEGKPHKMCTYKNDCGDIFKHHYDKGSIVLAIKMLRLLKKRGNL